MPSVLEQEVPLAELQLAQPNILREDNADGSFVL